MIPFLRKSYLSFIYFLLFMPIVILVLYSFNKSKYSQHWHGFTLRWYQALFADKNIFITAWHSFALAGLASTLATSLALAAALCLFRYRFAGRQLYYGLLLMLIVVPDIVLGISLLLLFNVLAIPLGFWSLLIAHSTLCVPLAVVTIYGYLHGFDKNLLDAAKDLGASDVQLFTQIIFPLLKPALIAAWLLCFTLSLDDVLISYFVSGPSFEILPLHIYSLVRVGVTPKVNALATILLVFTIFCVCFIHKLYHRGQGANL